MAPNRISRRTPSPKEGLGAGGVGRKAPPELQPPFRAPPSTRATPSMPYVCMYASIIMYARAARRRPVPLVCPARIGRPRQTAGQPETSHTSGSTPHIHVVLQAGRLVRCTVVAPATTATANSQGHTKLVLSYAPCVLGREQLGDTFGSTNEHLERHSSYEPVLPSSADGASDCPRPWTNGTQNWLLIRSHGGGHCRIRAAGSGRLAGGAASRSPTNIHCEGRDRAERRLHEAFEQLCATARPRELPVAAGAPRRRHVCCGPGRSGSVCTATACFVIEINPHFTTPLLAHVLLHEMVHVCQLAARRAPWRPWTCTATVPVSMPRSPRTSRRRAGRRRGARAALGTASATCSCGGLDPCARCSARQRARFEAAIALEASERLALTERRGPLRRDGRGSDRSVAADRPRTWAAVLRPARRGGRHDCGVAPSSRYHKRGTPNMPESAEREEGAVRARGEERQRVSFTGVRTLPAVCNGTGRPAGGGDCTASATKKRYNPAVCVCSERGGP